MTYFILPNKFSGFSNIIFQTIQMINSSLKMFLQATCSVHWLKDIKEFILSQAFFALKVSEDWLESLTLIWNVRSWRWEILSSVLKIPEMLSKVPNNYLSICELGKKQFFPCTVDRRFDTTATMTIERKTRKEVNCPHCVGETTKSLCLLSTWCRRLLCLSMLALCSNAIFVYAWSFTVAGFLPFFLLNSALLLCS